MQNVIERALNVVDGSTILPHNLPGSLLVSCKDTVDISFMSTREYEKQLIIKLLREYKGNRTAIARTMGISRTSLYRKLLDYNIKD